VDRPAPGFVSIAGGKYTTYRIMGKDVIDLAAIELRKLIPESVTDKLPLVGADGYFALVQQVDRLAEDSGLSAESITHLLNRYGSMISEVLELVKENPALGKKLSPELPYIKAEIYYAASHEGAQSIDDVISRRTRIAFEAHNSGLNLADVISEIIAPVLGWSTKERKSSVAAYELLVEHELAAMNEILKEDEKVNS
jgi:glycerol-3-phosphate dehydrogenase